ncbi:MAG TPA: MlaD family protein [Candidatus Cybelea sp.]|nr:MlaD family protein [Candidatus Cybelea sp.]
MAQRKLSWSELRVGIFALVALIIMALGIFYITGSRGLWVSKYNLRTYLPEVENLQHGAPVALDGLPIGNVETVTLTSHPQNKSANVTVVMRIDKKYRDEIRTDSTASLVTEGLLGNRYVEITRGVTGTPIPPGGVVPGSLVPEISDVVQRGYDVAQNLNVLSTQLSGIIEKMNRGEGTIGKFVNDPSLYNHFNEGAVKFEAMMTSVQEGNGTAGKLFTSDELYNRFSSVVGKVDDVMTAVRDQKGTMGRLIYDPSMAQNFKGIAEKSNAVISDVQAGKGSLGKFVTDDTAYNNFRDASANVRDATAKLNGNEGTLGKMFSNPALYDNMTGLAGDMRLLVDDFRRNPKKYLQIRVHIF